MKLTVKTTQQKIFQIDAELSDTIAILKQKIEQSQGHPVASQKIIYAGKILSDDKDVESCGIKEKDFLVLMVSKPKPTPSTTAVPSSSVTPTPAPQATPAAPPPAAAEATTPASAANPPESSAPASAAQTSTTPFGGDSSFLSGEALQTTINNMVDMGFPRDQVIRALRASFNNPDRAVEYLMTGIPAHLEAEAAPRAAPPPTAPAAAAPTPSAPAAAQPAAAAAPADQPMNLFQLAQQQQQQQQQQHRAQNLPIHHDPSGQGLDLNALQNNPFMQSLREQIASNPERAQMLLQQLAAQNPAMLQALAQNTDLAQMLGIEFEDGEGNELPAGTQVLSVTEEERAAIERLEALGFSRQAVIEAYFACDKNEELAANYLFENSGDD